MRRSRTERHGFTLIELLVVIAIIAILAAILFPIFARAKEAGLRTGCSSNMGQIYKSLLAYSDDYGGKLPWANAWYYADTWTQAKAPPPDPQWVGYLCRKYQSNSTNIWKCAANPYKLYDPAFGRAWNWVYYYNLFCGNVRWYVDAPSNVYNSSLAGHRITGKMDFSTDWIKDGSGKVMPWDRTRLTRMPIAWDQRRTVWDPQKNQPATDKIYELIHNGGWNVLFGDGHVKWWTQTNRTPFTPEGY